MATTPNYSFSVYSSTDTDVRFLDFRVATAGSQSTSNFYVIDTVLKQHSDAIDSINATPSAFVVKGTYSAGSLYTASVANYPGYKNEQLIVLSLNQKNTGAVQININGTTNKDVMKYGSDGVLKAVDAGDFVANSPVLCLYDGTRFVVIGITSASSITVTGEAGDILQIADDGTIESSGKKTAQPNGIATLDENGNVVQVANMANSAAAVYSGEPVTVEYAGAQRIASITAYGKTPQGGTTEAPVALTGVDSAILFEQHTPINLAKPNEGESNGISIIANADGSVTARGTATKDTWPVLVRINIPSSIVSGDITISLSSPASVVMAFQSHSPSGKIENVSLSAGYTSVTTKIKSGYTGMHIFLSLLPDQTIDETFHIMIAQGIEPVPFVPYVEPSVTPIPIPRPLRRVGDVRDVCRTRVKSVYDKRIVLDGSENWNIYSSKPNSFLTPVSERIVNGLSDSYPTLKSPEIGTKNGIYLNYTVDIIVTDLACSTVEEFKAHLSAHPLTVYYRSTAYDGTNGLDVCLTEYQTGYIESYADESITTAWISSTGELSTGAEVAYVLSSPETYATDPLDIDNAAGPLTVMTGGELEVRMTELVGSRSDVSNNTVAFTEAAQDADIVSGEKLSVLFGKIKKRFSVVNKLVNGAVYPNLGTNTNFPNPINQRGAASYTGDSTSPYCIDRWRISNGTTYTVGTFTLSAANYANRACGMWQTNLLGEHWLSIGDNVTVSIYANGQLHTAVMQVLDRDSYSSFADVPAGYTCDDFEIVLCTYAGDSSKYNLGVYPKKALTVNYIKWEKGSVATPYVPKGYGAELAECLRYFQRVHADWRIYPTLKDMLYRFSQSTLQVMRIKPTISAHGTPYTFGCTINALDAQPMAFTVETKITEQGQNSAAASMLGYFDLSADL